MDQTREHLRLLTIFHYVLAGVVAVFSCIPLIHLGFGLFFLLMPEKVMGPAPTPNSLHETHLVGWIFTAVGGFIVVAGWTMALLIFLAGRNLAARRRHTFCFVIAALECLFAPLGTVLGVLTILVLLKPEARLLFGLPPLADSPPAPPAP